MLCRALQFWDTALQPSMYGRAQPGWWPTCQLQTAAAWQPRRRAAAISCTCLAAGGSLVVYHSRSALLRLLHPQQLWHSHQHQQQQSQQLVAGAALIQLMLRLLLLTALQRQLLQHSSYSPWHISWPANACSALSVMGTASLLSSWECSARAWPCGAHQARRSWQASFSRWVHELLVPELTSCTLAYSGKGCFRLVRSLARSTC